MRLGIRAWLLAVSTVCVVAATAAEPAQQQWPGATIEAPADPAQLARTDRMLEALHFGQTYEAFLERARRDAEAVADEDPVAGKRRLRARVVGLLSWQRVSGLWRTAFAGAFTADTLEAITAFHESEAGRLYTACVVKTESPLLLTSCADALDEDQRASLWAFQASPAGQAFDAAGQQMAVPLMMHALRLALADAPDIAADLTSLCRRESGYDLCAALTPPPDPTGP